MPLHVRVSIDGTETSFQSGADNLQANLHLLFATADVSKDTRTRIMQAIAAARGQSVSCTEDGVSVSIEAPPAPVRPVSQEPGSPGGWSEGATKTSGGGGWGS